MLDYSQNIGIYFTHATNVLGSAGWIKVYDADAGTLIHTFTSADWSKYTSNNPYMYENEVGRIRVETSQPNLETTLSVYNIKELDDEAIVTDYSESQFGDLQYISSHLKGTGIVTSSSPIEKNREARAEYFAPESITDRRSRLP